MAGKRKVVLGADAGTHGVRILALRLPDCAVIAQSASGYSRRLAAGVQELEARDLEQAFFTALEALELPADTVAAGLGVTHQRGTMIPVDSDCRPLAPAFCDSDERAADVQGYRACGVDPAAYYRRSGCPVVSFNGFSKILWCRQNRPELWRQAAAWLSPQDYLLSRLSGRLQLSEGSALRSGFLDIHRREVWRDLLPGAPFLELDCTAVGTACGTAAPDWAERYPVLRGALLFAVPGDQPAAFLGSGAGGGAMAMNLGTTFVASAASSCPPDDPTALITTEVLPLGRYAPEFGTGAGGQFLDFLTGLLLGSVPDSAEQWARLDAEAAAVPAGAQGLQIVPLLWQATSAGVEGRITGFRPFHTRGHFFRAAYEGLAWEARMSLEKLAAACGARPEALRVFGGLSGCPGFLQILASVTGIPVEASGQRQASAFGAGLTCALGLGILTDADALRAAAGAPGCIRYPKREEQAYYEQRFQTYRACRQAIAPELPGRAFRA